MAETVREEFAEIRTLGLTMDREAQRLLVRAAVQAAPIMRRRGWKVSVAIRVLLLNLRPDCWNACVCGDHGIDP